MKTSSKNIWAIISSIFIVLTTIAELIFFTFIFVLKLLPLKLLIVIAITLTITIAFISFLAFFKIKKYPKIHAQQIIAYIISLCVMIACILGSLAANRLNKTVETITTPPEISTVMGVYVLKENKASNIADTKNFIFALNDSYDKGNNDSIVSAIEKELSYKIRLKHYETMLKSINALYKKEVDALIISESNTVILEDLQGYETFQDKVKLIYTVNIYNQAVQKPEKDKGNSNHTLKELFKEIADIIVPDKNNNSSNKNETSTLGNSNNNIESQSKPTFITESIENSENKEPIEKTDDSFIMFISGSDSRNGIMDKTLSDVNILAVINPKTKQILLVNTPRDFFIPNPAFNGRKDKLTHCGLYGIKCSVTALSRFYNVPIKYYVQFNFNGFETLIDLLGGVTVNSPKSFTTTHGHYYIKKGSNHLNGKMALSFVRERHAFLGGDDTRGWNQMQVIKNLIYQTTASTLVSNYADILKTVEGMFITNMDRSKISQLAEAQIESPSKWEIFSYAATGTLGKDYTATLGGDKVSVVYPHSYSLNKAKKLIKNILNDNIINKADLY